MHADFAHILISWYASFGRDLPWRHTRNPYFIWVSEIIMQQTQVRQGYDYYLRFIEHFPTVDALASAPEDEVLLQWQGLGYYSRARNMHRAAKQIVALGCFPTSYSDIRALSGVGDYTAAAIASLAFNLPHAVVDGNVYRVLSRYFGLDTPIDNAQGKKLFADLSRELLDTHQPALYNQAIMDFGALQCTPRGADCSACPLMVSCSAYRQNRVYDYPVKSHQTKVRSRYLSYIYVRLNNNVLIHKRQGRDIWTGLYEFPLIEHEGKPHSNSIQEADWLQHAMANGALLTRLVHDFRHQLSHQLLHVDFYILDCAQMPQLDGLWVAETALSDYAFPRLLTFFMEKFLFNGETSSNISSCRK